MICVDSDGNFTHPNTIKISELLNIHNLAINLPNQILDIIVDKEFKSATVESTKDSFIFKWNESTDHYSIEYALILNPHDSVKTVVELEDGDIMGYYSMDGSYYDTTI